ncbi:MAG: ATP-binding region ATPase domain protein [Ilumatobacteraceae bacterium]|nr:ATP-binding region ATPase domain protein [Ilumatobacteraceae bacterium]
MPPSTEISLDGSTADARRARRAVLELLGDGPPVSFVRDAVLLTSEVVTNATAHAPGPGRFRASYAAGKLRIDVTDGSTQLPEMADLSAKGNVLGGHGLRLLDTIASRWGVHPERHGKTVWFELVTT